jgi:hypothetical protein
VAPTPAARAAGAATLTPPPIPLVATLGAETAGAETLPPPRPPTATPPEGPATVWAMTGDATTLVNRANAPTKFTCLI